ncbi:polymeric immunoglobulin receptor-like [Engraulis encrasicolus]|uniref:polymeric immunoglobulin receptor-like n=1 Tax=Engraulis encrasicolus TaxID=184585 RepID=UPI002FD637F7
MARDTTLECVRTLRNLYVQRGGSVTVPCHYEEQHAPLLKYWCRGYTWDSCSILINTKSPSTPNMKLSINDDVIQHVFTVTMRNLQDADSGVYWCAAHIPTALDHKAHLTITVIPGPPELQSEGSVFSGPVGGLVQVRCVFSGRLQRGEKKWCRSGTVVCLTAGRTSKLSKYSLDTDTHTGVLTVTIRDLRASDAGWYWCAGRDTQLPVYVSVGLSRQGTEKPQPQPQTLQGQTTDHSGASKNKSARNESIHSYDSLFQWVFTSTRRE